MSVSTKYSDLAQTITAAVGGAANVTGVHHCQTRLRFHLRDEALVDRARLLATEGVATAMSSGGTYQVVIGTHVKDVYDSLVRDLQADGRQGAEESTVPTPHGKRRNPLAVIIDFISATFQPIIPAMAGAGMISALLALLVVFNVISRESQTYQVLAFFGNAVFYFLPVFVAFSAAQRLKTSPILAAVVAAMMLHPTWTQLVTAGQPVELFGLVPLTLASYSSTVIPILLIVVVQAHVERWFTRMIPDALKLVFVPMLTLLTMGTVAFTVLGPIGAIMGGWLANFFEFLLINAPWAPPLVVGTLFPIMVMFGVHNAIAPLGFAQLAQSGYDSVWGPGVITSNIAQGVATLVVAWRTKDKRLRRLAFPAGITALLGVTEPALYGVTLPRRYPLIAAMIGGGLGGLYAGLTATRRFAAGSSGLPAVLLYIGDDTLEFLVNILIALAITAVTTGVITLMLSFRFEKTVSQEVTPATLDDDMSANPVKTQTTVRAASGTVSTVVQARAAQLLAPVNGAAIPLSEIPDAAFASGALGPGIGVRPTDGRIIAPVSGTVVAGMDTGHAFGIVTPDGVEVLVHVGIDTVQLKGSGFTSAVPQGATVQAGDVLVNADFDTIRAAGLDTTVVLIVTGGPGAVEVTKDSADVVAGEPVIRVAV